MRSTLLPDGTLKEMPEIDEPGAEPESQEYSYYESKFYHSCHPFSGPDEEYSHDWRLHDEWQERTEAYNAALSKCRTFEIWGKHNWSVGQVLEQDKDYKLELQADERWTPTYNNPDDPPVMTVAVPISDSQEQLWNEILTALGFGFAGREKFISQAKEQFTISKKQ